MGKIDRRRLYLAGGLCALGAGLGVARWVVMQTPAIELFGTRVLAQRRRQAMHRVVQNCSGSFSTQPGCGDW